MPQARSQESSESSAEELEQDANTAESSGAEPADANAGDEESRDSLLSVISDVVDSEDGEDSESADDSSSSESEAEEASEVEESESDDEDEEDSESGEDAGEEDSEESDEDKPPPFHDHPRWKELKAERDRLKEPAENYQRLTQFMDENGLTAEETAEGFQLMALMKTDPATAYSMLEQKLQNLREFSPNYIPQDLQQEVADGAITEQRARELAKARAEANQARAQQGRLQQQHERTAQQHQQLQQRQAAEQQISAVNAWEQQIRSKDADYARKAPFVQDRLRALMLEHGRPQDTDGAVKLAKQAYEAVNKQFKDLAPQKKRPSKPTPSGGTSKATKEPSSLFEAVQQAAQGGSE